MSRFKITVKTLYADTVHLRKWNRLEARMNRITLDYTLAEANPLYKYVENIRRFTVVDQGRSC